MPSHKDSRHSVGGVPATNLGPYPPILVADWMAATLNGKSFPSEKWFVEATGRIVKTPLQAPLAGEDHDRSNVPPRRPGAAPPSAAGCGVAGPMVL